MKLTKYIWIVIVLSTISCEKATYKPMDVPTEGELPVLVQKELDRKYNKYLANIDKRCRAKALKQAIAYVDSIIVIELQLQTTPDMDVPDRPSRPTLPEGIILNDSAQVEPI